MHFSFHEIASKLSSKNWGREFESEEEAERELVRQPEKLAAFAIIELLRRLNKVAASVAQEDGTYRYEREPLDSGKAALFPGAKLGDLLYSYDIDDGLLEMVVIATDEDGRCQVTTVNHIEHAKDLEFCHFARSSDYRTPQEAMLAASKSDIEYYSPRLDFAKRLQDAIEKGEDLSQFENGINEEE